MIAEQRATGADLSDCHPMYIVRSNDETPGFVRQGRNVRRNLRLGMADRAQPREAFAIREEVGQQLVSLHAAAKDPGREAPLTRRSRTLRARAS